MKTLETQYSEYENRSDINATVAKATEQNKNKVKNTLSSQATQQLRDIFGLHEEEVHKLTRKETKELSDKNEVNTIEASLANMFGGEELYEKMIKLNSANEQDYDIQPISIASVMDDFEEYENHYSFAA